MGADPALPAPVDAAPAPQSRRRILGGAAALGLGTVLAALLAAEYVDQHQAMPESARFGHLLRRAGFGASPEDVQAFRPLGLPEATDRLLDYEALPNPTVAKIEELNRFDFTNAPELQRWQLLRMLYTTRPLEERMVLFWHNLLTSARSKVRPDMLYVQNQFFRAHALDRFPTILKGISRDPAMMVWLDLQTNRKGHANENFARELMELFTMGVGHYTERDVRESARAFTGYGLRYPGPNTPGVFNPPTFGFNARQHDDGVKTFLGHTGAFSGDDIIDLIVAQPATAEYLCRRLFAWFAYADPEPAALQALTTTYFAGQYSVKALVRQILTSAAFYSAKAYRATVKSPVDYVVGSLRSLGIVSAGTELPNVLPAMGQELFNPPNVAGWPGGTSWLNSGAWLARLNFANQVAAGQLGRPKGATSVQAWLGAATGGSPTAAVDLLAGHLIDGQLGEAQRQVLQAYAADPTLPADERLRGLTYLALGLPEHHLS